MRLVALALDRQESGHLAGGIVGVVGKLPAGGLCLGCGYTATMVAVADGLAWPGVLVPGSPAENYPLNAHFEASLAVAAVCVVGDVEVLVVGTVVGILRCSQAVVLEFGDFLQALLAKAVVEEEQQVPGGVERLESSVFQIPEAKVVAAGVLRF